MKFGRQPAVHTRRTMRLAIGMHAALAQLGSPPRSSDDYVAPVLKQSPSGWNVFLNDSLGDCVCADSGHQVMVHTANAGAIVIPTDNDILALYEAVGGYQPGNPSTDQGCDETSMCQYLMQTGLCGQKSAASGPVDPTNMDHLRWAVQLFGACRLGIIVDDSYISAFQAGQPWTSPVSPSSTSAGGHDVPIVKYDSEYAYVVTWGALQPVAWSLVANSQFLDEAHAEVWPDFISAAGNAPNGFDLQTLLNDLQDVESSS